MGKEEEEEEVVGEEEEVVKEEEVVEYPVERARARRGAPSRYWTYLNSAVLWV